MLGILLYILLALNPDAIVDLRDYNQVTITPTSAVVWSPGQSIDLVTWQNCPCTIQETDLP